MSSPLRKFSVTPTARPFEDDCVGQLLPAERKSVEPIAALVSSARVSADDQSLLHFIAQAPWSDEAVASKARALAPPAMIEQGGPIEVWEGEHPVGAARQYSRCDARSARLATRLLVAPRRAAP